MEQQYFFPQEPPIRKVRINSSEGWLHGDIVFVTHEGHYYTIEIEDIMETLWRVREYTTKIVETARYIKNFVKKNPKALVKDDLLQFLLYLGLADEDVEKIRSEIDKCLDEMAREKTGFNLDNESKTLLRNELVLASLILASK